MAAGLYARFGKRLLDVIAAGLGLVIVCPLLAIIAVVVKLTSPGPVLFRQQRVGRGGVPFNILKFRTMCDGAEHAGPGITSAGDPRITRVGALLRRSKLDEFPQLWNVLRGDMSLVGPRPELPAYVASYTPQQRQVLDLRPGITDPATLEYHDEEAVLARDPDPDRLYREIVLPHKLALSLRYRKRVTLATDVQLLGATLRRLFHCRRAYVTDYR